MQSPLVSVVILNYKRREQFARCLESVRRQSYANRELIVVDNNSQDGIGEYLAAHAPEARLIELAENGGAAAGRNAGIAAARGEIVITLDNNVFFESPFEIGKTVDTFERRPDVHILACQVCDEQTGALRVREWCHPRSLEEFGQTEFETNFFVEGACAIRREVYESAGLYYAPLFFGTEGWDLGLRALDKGFRMLYEPRVRIRHSMASETRAPDRPYYYYTRNYIWIAYKDYPFLAGVSFVTWRLLMMLYFSIRSRHLRTFLRGVKAGIAGLPQVRRVRTTIRPATVRYVRELERGRPPLWARFSRHREAVQI